MGSKAVSRALDRFSVEVSMMGRRSVRSSLQFPKNGSTFTPPVESRVDRSVRAHFYPQLFESLDTRVRHRTKKEQRRMSWNQR